MIAGTRFRAVGRKVFCWRHSILFLDCRLVCTYRCSVRLAVGGYLNNIRFFYKIYCLLEYRQSEIICTFVHDIFFVGTAKLSKKRGSRMTSSIFFSKIVGFRTLIIKNLLYLFCIFLYLHPILLLKFHILLKHVVGDFRVKNFLLWILKEWEMWLENNNCRKKYSKEVVQLVFLLILQHK